MKPQASLVIMILITSSLGKSWWRGYSRNKPARLYDRVERRSICLQSVAHGHELLSPHSHQSPRQSRRFRFFELDCVHDGCHDDQVSMMTITLNIIEGDREK